MTVELVMNGAPLGFLAGIQKQIPGGNDRKKSNSKCNGSSSELLCVCVLEGAVGGFAAAEAFVFGGGCGAAFGVEFLRGD